MNWPERLRAGEIHLHLSADPEIGDVSLLDAYESLLSADERARRDRFHFPRHRHQFLVSRALLRTTLSLYRPSVTPEAWRFAVNAHGRPRVLDDTSDELDFNLSHSEGRVVLAVSACRSPGVDIEALDRAVDMLELASQFFAPAELTELSALDPALQRRRFFDLWTLKEAYVKARGLGLAIPLAAFAIGFPGEGGLSIRVEPEASELFGPWRLWSIDAGPGHALSLAIRHDGPLAVRQFESRPLEMIAETACRVLRNA